MIRKFFKFFRVSASTLALLALAGTAYADAIITDGNVSLGVDDYGQLNIPGGVDSAGSGLETWVGVRWIDQASGDQYESTSHGCYCEGWGIAYDGTDSSLIGYANNDVGVFGLSLVGFGSTATTAGSQVTLGDLSVTHAFALSPDTDNLYEVTVTITNMGDATASNVEYRRTMDWDADPSPFDEYVTINSGTATALASYSNDGFASSNPLSSIGCLSVWTGSEYLCPTDVDFTDLGPSDHGANFDFAFGDLAAGESIEFSIFYGGAESNAAALATVGAVGAEVYSFGRSACDSNGDGLADTTSIWGSCSEGDLTPTYIFAFSGVGGDPIVDVPEPGTLALFGLGLFGMGMMRRRRT